MSLRHLLADEIGLETAVISGWRLQTTYAPVYGRAGPGLLAPSAVLAGTLIRPLDEGSAARTANRDGPLLQAVVATSGLALSLRNHPYAGCAQFPLFLELPSKLLARPSLVRRALQALPCVGVSPHALVAFVDAPEPLAAAHADAMGLLVGAGIRLGLTVTQSTLYESVAGPALLRIDPSSLRSALRDRGVRDLLRLLVGHCHARGGEALAAGLRLPEELELADAVGCDLFEGPLLGGQRLAGAEMDLALRPPGRPARPDAAILPFSVQAGRGG